MRQYIFLGILPLLAIIGVACGEPEPSSTANLQQRAEQWASYISTNDWVTAYATFAPALIDACGTDELADFQRRFLQGKSKPAVDVAVTTVKTNGEVGHVYFKVTSGSVTYREDPVPDKWVFQRGQWWYGPDEPQERCVRYDAGYTRASLGVSREAFLSAFFSETSRIYGMGPCADGQQGLPGFELTSEEYELIEGGTLSAILEQRLPRMQRITTYNVRGPSYPDLIINWSTRLTLSGEDHALTQVLLHGAQDYFETDPCQARQLAYFIALGIVLAPEWARNFGFLGWFKGGLGTDGGYYGKEGQELTDKQSLAHEGVRIFVRDGGPCNLITNPLCPPLVIRWTANVSVDVGARASIPLPSCKESPNAYRIRTGKRCP